MVQAVGVQATQALALAITAEPAQAVRATQGVVLAIVDAQGDKVQATQALVLAIGRGRIADPKIRVWGYTIDSHDFFVVRLGAIGETLQYDLLSNEWSIYGSDDSNLWRAYTGVNWGGAWQFLKDYGTNVVVGDDGSGALYFLDPRQDYDDDVLQGNLIKRPFDRELTGQAVVKFGYDSVPCYGVQLFGDIGKVSGTVDDLTVELSYSDDRGVTYNDAGAVTLAAGSYDARANWLSLGSMTAPGRLFKVKDRGVLRRIDSLFMEDGEEDDE